MDAQVDRVPADAGASGVGLVMQAAGRALFWGAVYGLAIVVVGPGRIHWGVAGVLALSGLRSAVHDRVGRRVARGELGGLPLYFGVAAVHSLGVLALILQIFPRFGAWVPLLVALIAWPAVLWGVLYRPAARAKRAGGRQPVAEDRGLTGLAALMAGFGILGSLLTGIGIALLLLSERTPALIMIVGLALLGSLLVRGVIHAQAGLRMLRDFDPLRFHQDRERYFVAAAVSAGLLAVLLVFVGMTTHLLVAVIAAPLVGLLMSWPLVVRDCGTVSIEDYEDAAVEQATSPAPDAGLSTLAVILLASAAWSGASLIGALVGDSGASPMGAVAALTFALKSQGLVLPGLLLATQLWSGLELLGLGPRARLAAWVNLACVLGATIYNGIEVFELLRPARGIGLQHLWAPLAGVLGPLVIPTLAVVQLRRLPAATDLRRYAEVF